MNISRAPRGVLLVLLLLMLEVLSPAQTAGTSVVAGTLLDPTDSAIPKAAVVLTNPDTNRRYVTTSTEDGTFSFPLLPPGSYKLLATHAGFRDAEVPRISVEVGAQVAVQVRMQVATTQETVAVEAAAAILDQSPSVAAVVSRQFVENLPLNGRSFQTLLTAVPGVSIVPASSDPLKSQGQFSVNGQRDNANYFTVDGVSANIGINSTQFLYASGSGTLPGLSAQGGTNSLVSVDAMEEFRVITSSFAPEYGRMPGGQIAIVTRSGTNQFHGSAFDYLRNDVLDANDWFANRAGLGRPALRQNDFGGVLGGPAIKDRLFFFGSFEGLRLTQPVSVLTAVPSLASRQLAPAGIRPLLNAYPLPTGMDLGNGTSELSTAFSNSSTLNATSIRLDSNPSDRIRVFGRYNYAPSDAIQRGADGGTVSSRAFVNAKTETLTAGSSQILTPRLTNDFRLNWSRSLGETHYQLDSFGGAVVPSDAALFPGFPSSGGRFMRLNLRDVPLLLVGDNARNRLTQLNVVDGFSANWGRHLLQAGVDWRRIDPVPDYVGGTLYSQWANFDGVGTDAGGSAQPGTALSGVSKSTSVSIGKAAALRFLNFSAFVQDQWRVNQRLTLTYGLRWEVNPAVGGRDGTVVYAVKNLAQPQNLALDPGAPLYATRYRNLAPRIGISYQLRGKPGWETVLRGGAGTFYDTGFGITAGITSEFPNYPYYNYQGIVFPLPPDKTAAPPFSTGYPVTEILVADPRLELPRTYQWNAAIEQALGGSQNLSVSYVGAVGRKLLRNEYLIAPNDNFENVLAVRNASTSDYHSLQVRFQRRLARGIQALVSYTWSHSIDTGSNDAAWGNVPLGMYDPNRDRGSSDFDIRQAFRAALTWNLPSPADRTVRRFLGGFSLDSVITARSSAPVDLVGGIAYLHYLVYTRPDLVPGQPLYLNDPNAGGGRRFNPVAFAPTPIDDYYSAVGQGTLGRNVLRGFPLSQVDLAVRRDFKLSERLALQFRVEAFNLLNHPAFDNPQSDISSGLFGYSTQVASRGLGTGGPTAGLTPLYQVGGPRSLQLALRVRF